MKIAVIGTGYVGLVTGVCLAEIGNKVSCIDIDERKIKKLKKGISPIFEEGLEDLIKKNLTLPRRGSATKANYDPELVEGECAAKAESKRLSFSNNLEKEIPNSHIIFIAVGTPEKEDGSADLSQVENAAVSIGQALAKLPKEKQDYKIIVNKSTVPIGTGDLVSKLVKKYYDGLFDVVSNPEFLREGSAIFDFMHPDRIVIGGESEKAKTILKKVFQPLAAPVLLTDLKTAEMIKYASNSFLATSISFINSVANLCEKVGADVTQVAAGMRLDKRIGKRAFLDAGPGWGGSCFPKDVKALVQIADENYTQFEILQAALEQNERQKKWILGKLFTLLPELKDKKIALWGVAFKAGTDDVREAPALKIIEELLAAGAEVLVFDPQAAENTKKIFPQVAFANSALQAADGADALIILTEWSQFKKINLPKLKLLLKTPLVVDGRNLFNVQQMYKLGFQYISVGRQWLEPKVTIVIPLNQVNQYLYESLPHIFNIDLKNYEVLILPDQIGRQEKGLLTKAKKNNVEDKMKVIATGKIGPAQKRDFALNYATGSILAFLDDDAYPASDWLKVALRHFQNPAVAAVGGPAVTPAKSGFWEKVSGAVYESLFGGGTARFRYLPTGTIREVDDFPSVNFLIKKESLQKVGGFASQFWPGEDTKLCQQIVYTLGQKIIYDPQAVVYHHRRKTLADHLKQVLSYSVHRGYFAKKFPKTSLRPAYFAPSLFVLWLLTTAGLLISRGLGRTPLIVFGSGGEILGAQNQSLWTISPLSIALAILLIYAIGLLVSVVQIAFKNRNIILGVMTAPAIFFTHVFYGIGFVVGLSTKNLKSKMRYQKKPAEA